MEKEDNSIIEDILGGSNTGKKINSKRKGNNNELLACEFMKKWVGLEFNRVPNSGGLRWINAEGITGDIVCEDRTFPFSIETKHLKKISIGNPIRKNTILNKVWLQCKNDAIRGKKEAMVLLRRNRMERGRYIVLLPLKYSKYCPVLIGSTSEYIILLSNNLPSFNTIKKSIKNIK